jgi:RsiW-degrading membrane proteinase PrsW (M82 family)
LTGIPIVLLSGLVQEGAKLVPVIALWFKRNRRIDPLTGLYAGAISGAGFGIFEAVWVHNSMFAAGWSWQIVTLSGPSALLGFVERFFSIGFHIAISALAGYGWARGLKWQYYLVAAGLHGLSNYAIVLLNQRVFTINQVEIYVAVMAVASTIYAFMVMRGALLPESSLLIPEFTHESEPPDSSGSGSVE